MTIQVIGNTSFIGHTGYANHSRNFFTHLNRYIPTRIRNFSYVPDISYLKKEEYDLLIEQEWKTPPYKIGHPYVKPANCTEVNIVLNESHHYFFYDNYNTPLIFYNVWEGTKQLPEFFNRMLEADQFWCPTEWQKQYTIEQGYPENKIRVIPEGVNSSLFKPPVNSDEQFKIRERLYNKYNIPFDAFTFMIFGRWDYRKSITEIVRAFNDEFKNNKNVYLIISADNPFSVDSLNSTEERLEKYKLQNDRIKVLHFPEQNEYIKWLQAGHCFLSCSRSEGWNLPLLEAIACGTPTICSNWSGQLEFAKDVSTLVNIEKFIKPKNVFMLGDNHDFGVWAEPDFNHLQYVMRDVFEKYSDYKIKAIKNVKSITEKFTWENAAKKAEYELNQLVKNYHTVPEVVKTGIKLNLGCGNDIKEGYINIDRYNNLGLVDIISDISSLPFKNKSVDKIYNAHVIEHISLNDIYAVMSEWRRVLVDGGILELHLPDLETEVNHWLNSSDENKWFSVHRIFGSQSHKGNSHLCGFNKGSLRMFLESFDFQIKDLEIRNNGVMDEIQCTAIKKKSIRETPSIYNCHFVDGPFVEIKGNDKAFYQVDFFDHDNKSHVHQQLLKCNNWTRPHRKYYTNWYVFIRRNGKLVYKHQLNLKNKHVLISLDSKSLGDTISWFPYIEEFRKKHECVIYASTFWNELFKDHPNYKDIIFVDPGSTVQHIYASYSIGCFDNDKNKNKFNWRTIPLQKVSSDFLGLDYKEIITDIGIKPGERPIQEKYVAITEHSTLKCKYWNKENGWQEAVDYLNSIGYKVMVISKEPTKLKNIIDMTSKPINETVTNIYHSEFFIGVGTGPSWLAWALRKPIILISGFSNEFTEFQTNIERVINKEVCNSCFNDINSTFDRGNWEWCPKNKNFECSKEITFEIVKKSIDKIIKNSNELT